MHVSTGLNLNYLVTGWGEEEAHREWIVNLWDEARKGLQGDLTVVRNKNGWSFQAPDGTLRAAIELDREARKIKYINKNAFISEDCLTLGHSTKRDGGRSGAIGYHGEGFKLAVLLATREHFHQRKSSDKEYAVVMKTGQDFYKFDFHNPAADVRERLDDLSEFAPDTTVLYYIKTKRAAKQKDNKDTVIEVLVKDWRSVQRSLEENFLFLDSNMDTARCFRTEYGSVLLDDRHKGRLFYKSVAVGEPDEADICFGYDLDWLTLDRDRDVPDDKTVLKGLAFVLNQAIEKYPDFRRLYCGILREQPIPTDARAFNHHLISRTSRRLILGEFQKEVEGPSVAMSAAEYKDLPWLPSFLNKTALVLPDHVITVKKGVVEPSNTMLARIVAELPVVETEGLERILSTVAHYIPGETDPISFRRFPIDVGVECLQFDDVIYMNAKLLDKAAAHAQQPCPRPTDCRCIVKAVALALLEGKGFEDPALFSKAVRLAGEIGAACSEPVHQQAPEPNAKRRRTAPEPIDDEGDAQDGKTVKLWIGLRQLITVKADGCASSLEGDAVAEPVIKAEFSIGMKNGDRLEVGEFEDGRWRLKVADDGGVVFTRTSDHGGSIAFRSFKMQSW